MSIALIPVKRLADTKSRLFASGDHGARTTLALAMLRDVIDALRGTAAVDRVVVATPDERVAAVARGAGAEARVRDDAGLNEALTQAAKSLAPAPDEPLLVVLGDVAGALPSDFDTMFEALDELLRPGAARGAVLAPSSDGGSSALLRLPYDAIPACFGPQSSAAHRAAAEERGVAYRELALESLALDLDVAEDIEQFRRTARGGNATRQALRELGPGERR